MLQNVTEKKSGTLSRRQAAALPYAALEPSISAGARAARISRCTLVRWMREPAFRAEFERVRRSMADLPLAELDGILLESVRSMMELLDNPDPNVRHRAAKTLLSTSIAARQDKELRRRIETLDNALIMLKAQR